MNTYNTEEEQIAALKNWWKENGNSLLIGIGAALLIIFGWKAYQNSVVQDKTEASLLYQQLVSSVSQFDNLQEGEEAQTVAYLAGELKEKFPGTEYGLYASLYLAKEAASEKKLDEALAELNWAKENTEDSRLQHIINGRIARVLSAQEKHEDAISMLNAKDPAFAASYAEIKGDIYMRKGDEESAVKEYSKAFELVQDNPQAQPLLAVKLSNLGVNPDTL